MGVMQFFLDFLLDSVQTHHLSGRLATFGRQDVYTDEETLENVAKRVGFPLRALTLAERGRINREFPPAPFSPSPDARLNKRINDQIFFRRLGFSSLCSIDHSDYEGATTVYDMNTLGLAEKVGRFDTVLDIGTMEHVFHVPNFLDNLVNILEVGGNYSK